MSISHSSCALKLKSKKTPTVIEQRNLEKMKSAHIGSPFMLWRHRLLNDPATIFVVITAVSHASLAAILQVRVLSIIIQHSLRWESRGIRETLSASGVRGARRRGRCRAGRGLMRNFLAEGDDNEGSDNGMNRGTVKTKLCMLRGLPYGGPRMHSARRVRI